MKRLLFLALTLFVVLSMAACSNSAVSDEQAQKDIETVLGDFKQLPMDIDDIREKLSDDVLVESSDSTGEERPSDQTEKSTKSTTIVAGDGVALYSSIIEDIANLANGSEYSFKVTVIHLGSATEGKDGAYNLHFIGANIAMEIGAADPEAVRQELLSQIDQMELSGDDASLIKDLIDGKQIYASTSSYLWELYSEVSVDVQATYDTQTNSFVVKEEDSYDEMLDQYSYEIMDFSGRVKQCVYYKVDDAGTKWITENYEYTYLTDGTIKKHSTNYWEYTTIIQSEDVTLEFEDTTTKTLWYRDYYDNGTLEEEQYYNDDGNCVIVTYDFTGKISYKEIRENDPEGETIYEEEYYANGNLWKKFSESENIVTREEYYDNGHLASSETFDLTRRNEDGHIMLQSKKGYADGRVDIYEYYENGKLKSRTEYSPDGEVLEATYYDENGNITESYVVPDTDNNGAYDIELPT